MNRRNLLSAGPALMVLAGVAGAVPAASSPILNAGRRIADLNRQHEAADVPGAAHATLDRIWQQIWALERSILAAQPATVTEAMVVLMVAAGQLHVCTSLEGADGMVDAAMLAAARATHCLACAGGVTAAEFGGEYYLPASSTGRAA